MALNLEYLRIFYAVARNKSISHAADELHLSQPTVTKELKRLEEQTGFPLFVRHSRGVHLTQEGEYLFRRLDTVMQELLRTEAETEKMSELQSGSIRICYSSTVVESVLDKPLREFQAAFPGFRILTCVAPRGMMCPLLNNGMVDIAFGNRPASFAVTERWDNARTPLWQPETLAGYSMGIYEDVFLAGPQLAHLADRKLKFQDLADYPLLFQRVLDVTGRSYYLNNIRQDPQMREDDIVIEDLKGMLQLTRLVPWVSITTNLALKLYEEKDLFPLQVEGDMISSEYMLYYSKQNPPCLAAAVLIDYIRNDPAFTISKLDNSN